MNTSGLENLDILKNKLLQHYDIKYFKNIVNIITSISEEYYFSEYYDILIEFDIKTPYSNIFFNLYDLKYNQSRINDVIKLQFNGKVFARLDTCSTNPNKPYTNAQEILDDISTNERTKYVTDNTHKIILREYINLTGYIEIRCFIEDKKLRGITSTDENNEEPTNIILTLIKKLVDKIVFYSEFDNCTLDFAVNNITNDCILIEINTPCWLCATSGFFDLSLSSDIEILFGLYKPEYINYPVLKF